MIREDNKGCIGWLLRILNNSWSWGQDVIVIAIWTVLRVPANMLNTTDISYIGISEDWQNLKYGKR